MINKARAMAALVLTAVFLITSCSGTGSSASSPTSSNAATTLSSPSASQSTAPGMFTSATYGYAVTLPASMSTSTPAAWAVSTPWKRDLAAYTRFSIDWTNQFHADTCPAEPATRRPVTIGGQPGVLLAYDCGILINLAATVHSGFGYWFLFRDEAVQAATDPTDHATFLKILRSVHFPA